MGCDEGGISQYFDNGFALYRNQVGKKIGVINFGI